MTTERDEMRDAELRREFAEMVAATEQAAALLARPWKLATATLAVMLAAAVLWRK